MSKTFCTRQNVVMVRDRDGNKSQNVHCSLSCQFKSILSWKPPVVSTFLILAVCWTHVINMASLTVSSLGYVEDLIQCTKGHELDSFWSHYLLTA